MFFPGLEASLQSHVCSCHVLLPKIVQSLSFMTDIFLSTWAIYPVEYPSSWICLMTLAETMEDVFLRAMFFYFFGLSGDVILYHLLHCEVTVFPFVIKYFLGRGFEYM